MKALLTLALITTSLSTFAQDELYQPIQRPYPQYNYIKGMQKNKTANDIIDLIKVKIFPHDGKYTAPQGGESHMDRVTVKTKGSCEVKTPAGNIITISESHFKAIDFSAGPAYMKCDAPLTVIREGAKENTYRGTFSFHKEGDKLVIVNYVTLKNYLKGVIPTEVYASWPEETLKAQAVAARTYAVNQIIHERNTNPDRVWEIDDTVMYQAYMGYSREHKRTSKAVEETEGEFMTDSAGNVITAYFSADSGGHTEKAVNVWGVDLDYTPSKPEVYNLSLIKSKWTREYSMEEIEKRLIKRKIITSDFKLKDFEVIEYTESGRMLKVLVSSEEGRQIEVQGEKFRYGMALKSSLVTFTKLKNGNYQLDGLGWGHGVGMNQNGAMVLAKHIKWDYKQILNFYYEGISF